MFLRSPGKAYVEGDASSASYFLAGAAITGGTITVEGCGTSSLQVLSLLDYDIDLLHFVWRFLLKYYKNSVLSCCAFFTFAEADFLMSIAHIFHFEG